MVITVIQRGISNETVMFRKMDLECSMCDAGLIETALFSSMLLPYLINKEETFVL